MYEQHRGKQLVKRKLGQFVFEKKTAQFFLSSTFEAI